MSPREVHHRKRVRPPRPLHDLLLLLPRLELDASTPDAKGRGKAQSAPPCIDWAGSNADVVAAVAIAAGGVARIAAHGVTAVGQLLTHCAPEIEVADISSEVVEALGRLLAELGELAAVCGYLEASAKRATVDYEPLTSPPIGALTVDCDRVPSGPGVNEGQGT